MHQILVGKGTQPVHLLAKYGNRHGLVAGATGTGKTVSLMVLAVVCLAATMCAGCENDSEAVNTERNLIIDRVWVRTDATVPPGAKRVFLSDGTLVSDSCWETYRLSSWQLRPGGTLIWREDEADIRAEIVESTDTALVLRLLLVDGEKLEHYEAASVPYVCPDIPDRPPLPPDS